MRILLVNNHHKIIGGAERYYFDLGELLKKNGHTVAYFSTNDNGNQKTKWSKFFIKKLDFKRKSFKNSIDKFPKIFYSSEAKKNIGKLLDEFKPDIVHLQNIYYYITTSIIGEITKREIPIVQTVHDYQLISPSVVMYHDGGICEVCKRDKYYKAVFHKCVKKSYLATLMSVITLYFQNFNNLYSKRVDIFITPSVFLKNKLIEYGYPKNKIKCISNFLFSQRNVVNDKILERYVLYFGRICEAKGIYLVLNAAEQLPNVNFKVAGNFEDSLVRKNIFNQITANKIRNIDFLGFKKGSELKKLISHSQFVVIPSLWYENQPYSVLESFALKKTVVAANIGGVPELVNNKVNGLLFDPNDSSKFVRDISSLWSNKKMSKKMGVKAKQKIDVNHSPKLHYKNIMAIYKSVVTNK